MKINTWFGVLEIGRTGEVLESELFSKDIRELARRSIALQENMQDIPPAGFDLKAAAIECATCHGPVATRDVLQKEVSTSMRTCVECHRGRKASTDCSRCHELGQ